MLSWYNRPIFLNGIWIGMSKITNTKPFISNPPPTVCALHELIKFRKCSGRVVGQNLQVSTVHWFPVFAGFRTPLILQRTEKFKDERNTHSDISVCTRVRVVSTFIDLAIMWVRTACWFERWQGSIWDWMRVARFECYLVFCYGNSWNYSEEIWILISNINGDVSTTNTWFYSIFQSHTKLIYKLFCGK